MEKYRSYAEEAREFAFRSFREEDRQFWLQIEQSWLGMMNAVSGAANTAPSLGELRP